MPSRQIVTFAASAALALLAAAPAAAAPGPVDPVEVFAAGQLGRVQAGVSPAGETLVAFENGTLGDPRRILAAVRSPAGVLGAPAELSRTTNAEVGGGPAFDAAGNSFLTWGIATTGASGEFTFRPAGGPFELPVSHGGASVADTGCTRFHDAAYEPSGRLLLACSVQNAGTAPNTLGVRAFVRVPGAASFTGNALLQSGTQDPFLQPKVAVGPEGTRAVAWRVRTTAPGVVPATTIVRVAVAPAGAATFETAANVASVTSATEQAELQGVAVLGDGRVAVLFTDPTLRMAVRAPGPAQAFGTPVIVPGGAEGGRIARDGNAGAGLLVLGRREGPGITAPRTVLAASVAPGGAIGTPVPLGTAQGLNAGDPLVAPGGAAAIPRVLNPSTPGAPTALGTWLRPAGGAFSPAAVPVATIPANLGLGGLGAGIAANGDVAMAWGQRDGAGVDRVLLGGIDQGAPPSLSGLETPSVAVAGSPAGFAVSAADPSGIRAVTWDFGDGSTAAGARVAHAFPRAGTFTVRVGATDRAGNATAQTRTVRVLADETPDRTAPTVSLSVPGRLTFARIRSGLTVRLRLGERADVTGELLARARSARIAARPFNLVLARRTVRRSATRATLRLKPARSLLGGRRALTLRLRVSATDAAGNRRTVQRTLRVRR